MKVSIIISTRNREKVLPRAINSALKQTYNDLEVVIVDDASEDKTKDISFEYARREPKVKYYRQEKQLGIAATWQKAFFKYSTGDLITVLNDDDEFYDDKYIEKSIGLFNKYNNKNIVCMFSNVLYKHYYPEMDLVYEKVSYDNLDLNFISGKNLFFSDIALHTDNGAIYKKEALSKLNLFENDTFSLDLELLYKLMLCGNFAFLPEVTYVHHLTNDSLGRTSSKKFVKSLQSSKWLDIVYKFYLDKYGYDSKIKNWYNCRSEKYWKSLLHLIEFDYAEYLNYLIKTVPNKSKVTIIGDGKNLEFLLDTFKQRRDDIECVQILGNTTNISKNFVYDKIIIAINDYIKSSKILFELLDKDIKKEHIYSIILFKLGT